MNLASRSRNAQFVIIETLRLHEGK